MDARVLDQITKLNDSVYELHKPMTGKPTMDVVFFHGLQIGDSADAFWTTWTSGKGKREHLWPKTWLGEAFPRSRILSVSYDACVMETSKQGRFDMFNIGESLTSDLIEFAKVGQECPVVLVGHSFGRLVIKQLCLRAFEISNLSAERDQVLSRFLTNVKGMMFYGTPHRGIPLEMVFPVVKSGPLLDLVKLLSKSVGRLNHDFDLLWKKNPDWKIFGVGEALPTTLGSFCGLIVHEASARHGDKFSLMAADHISLCKAEAETSSSYLYLKDLLEIVNGLKRPFEHFQTMHVEQAKKAKLKFENLVKVERESTCYKYFSIYHSLFEWHAYYTLELLTKLEADLVITSNLKIVTKMEADLVSILYRLIRKQ